MPFILSSVFDVLLKAEITEREKWNKSKNSTLELVTVKKYVYITLIRTKARGKVTALHMLGSKKVWRRKSDIQDHFYLPKLDIKLLCVPESILRTFSYHLSFC